MSSDQFATEWARPSPDCAFCGERLEPGQRVLSWNSARVFVAHADCIKGAARGLMKDIAECLR